MLFSAHVIIIIRQQNGEKEILMKKNVSVEQMLKYLGYEKMTREMLEEYVQGIYVYDGGRVEVEWRKEKF